MANKDESVSGPETSYFSFFGAVQVPENPRQDLVSVCEKYASSWLEPVEGGRLYRTNTTTIDDLLKGDGILFTKRDTHDEVGGGTNEYVVYIVLDEEGKETEQAVLSVSNSLAGWDNTRVIKWPLVDRNGNKAESEPWLYS
jgi:hypothetical protein